MAARLGYAIYWLGCILAVLCIALGVGAGANLGYGESWYEEWEWGWFLIPTAIGVAIWVIGRGIRYVLAGD